MLVKNLSKNELDPTPRSRDRWRTWNYLYPWKWSPLASINYIIMLIPNHYTITALVRGMHNHEHV